MQQRTIVVTGANSGIGKAMARTLASEGHRVVMACRSLEKGEAARAEIVAKTGSDAVELLRCDVSELDSIAAFAEQLRARHPKIDVLVNNAGVYLEKRQVNSRGVEMMFAVNHLGPFALTRALLPALGAGRVVTVSSIGHLVAKLHLANLQGEKRFVGMSQYGVTKLCNILFTRELARREGGRGLVAHCFHPGAVGTEFAQDERTVLGALVRRFGWLLRSPEKGGDTGVFLATSDAAAARNGEYWVDRKVRRPSPEARRDDKARALWDYSERLIE